MVRDNALSTAPGNDSSGSPQSAGLSAARTDGAAAGVAVGNGARGGPGQSGDDFPRTTPTSPSADQESAIGQLGSRGGVVCLCDPKPQAGRDLRRLDEGRLLLGLGGEFGGRGA